MLKKLIRALRKNELVNNIPPESTEPSDWKYIGVYGGSEFYEQHGIDDKLIEWTDEITYLKEPLHNEVKKLYIFKEGNSVYASCEVIMNTYIYFIYTRDTDYRSTLNNNLEYELLYNHRLIKASPDTCNKIKQNVNIDTDDVTRYCKKLIFDKKARYSKNDGNWYVHIDNYVLTINTSSRIITAVEKIKK